MKKKILESEIWGSVSPRLIELMERVEKKKANPAYMVAFQRGMIEDVKGMLRIHTQDILKKIGNMGLSGDIKINKHVDWPDVRKKIFRELK